jgi:hypothetical protein
LRQDPPRGGESLTVTSMTSIFDLPENLSAKADPALIATDEHHFASIATSLDQSIAALKKRLDMRRRTPGVDGQEALERDLEVHRLTADLRTLQRYGLDLCLGRMVPTDGAAPVYIGRIGLTSSDSMRLLLDWRSPAAEPFFGATHANPMGLASRRRYRWKHGLISDYWDEAFTGEALESDVALDDQSAFIASLAGNRSSRMRDVLGTIQADQDAIIRASSQGALVVDGGPGTGKTVVALHRTAYLLYSDARLNNRANGVLFVGPSRGYLAYVDDVLPSLGEDSVQICTLRDLVAESAQARRETDPTAARLKASSVVVDAIDAAVRLYERPPTSPTEIETPWADVIIRPADWSEAFAAADPASSHNEARDQVWDALLDILLDIAGEHPEEEADEFDAYGQTGRDTDATLRAAFAESPELRREFGRAWPLLEATDVVAALWSRPDYLRASAPELAPNDVQTLQREDARAWTFADLPLLDAARLRLGDPKQSSHRHQRAALLAAERARMTEVVDELIATDDSELGIMKMLRGQDLRATLVDESALPLADADFLAGPFAHIVVDEAQELTDAEWLMLLRRCPSRSFTIVGDRAQARHGFTESWQERLERVGLRQITLAPLTINYRTPEEIMDEAGPVIHSALPDANVPTSIRKSGIPVERGSLGELESLLEEWLAENVEGIACVIGDPDRTSSARVQSLTPELSKGLEFDLVVLIEPETFGTGIEGAVDRYVAMTRATQRLVVLTG